jgi:hypothetical protein
MAREEIKRKIRINELLLKIQKKESVQKEQAIEYCGWRWGTARRTALEYIKILIGCGFIKEIKEEGVVYLEVDIKPKKNIISKKEMSEIEKLLDANVMED